MQIDVIIYELGFAECMDEKKFLGFAQCKYKKQFCSILAAGLDPV
jgi:hypothetical protein